MLPEAFVLNATEYVPEDTPVNEYVPATVTGMVDRADPLLTSVTYRDCLPGVPGSMGVPFSGSGPTPT
ncbi:hypothetical protein GCM10028773_00120 [Spirosoma koreense]